MASPDSNYAEIVLTGGPGAGKSSSLAYLTQKLGDRGIRVLCPQEVATTFVLTGLSDLGHIAAHQPKTFFEVERQMILFQGDLRRCYQALARALAPQRVAIVYDRAEMDARAYLGDEKFFALLEEEGLTLNDVRDSYDAVIHMVTAADGAAEFYTQDNNEARRENAEEAIAADRRTLAAWMGCPKLWIAANGADGFEGKLRRVLDAVLHTMGQPAPEIERKFLIGTSPDRIVDLLPSHAQRIDIEQTYLQSAPGEELRVRKRSQDGQHTYFLTRKTDRGDSHRSETEKMISPSQYVHLLVDADPDLAPISKARYCFAHDGQFCELDLIGRPDGTTLVLLEVELLSVGEDIRLPGWLDVTAEVTDDPAYRNATLAQR